LARSKSSISTVGWLTYSKPAKSRAANTDSLRGLRPLQSLLIPA
jgi:hypothetical protein